MKQPPSDDGFATVWAAGAIAALLALVTVIACIGAAVVTRHRAESAADLAALSAATQALSGDRFACDKARWVADRMRVDLVDCHLRGWDVTVRVAAGPPGPLAGFGPAHASARAGPVGNGRAVGHTR
ncbi:Rv3654c family TadE-like protein [Actinokineospora sp.]|uniref:Rv3654c family TadE-like protein n=1 Tax=Actinokineospora sp. TaxID=1872133 RepID=UPI004037A0E3